MNNNNIPEDKRLLEILDGIDDKYISEVAEDYEVLDIPGEYTPNKRRVRKAYAVALMRAACVVLLAGLVAMLPALIQKTPFIGPAGSNTNEETTPETTPETIPETTPPDQTAVFNFDSLSKRVDFIGSAFAAPYDTRISDKTCDMILSVLNTGEWQKGVLDSLPEFTFEAQIQAETLKIEYNTSGSFRYNGYCKIITKKERSEINSYLRSEDPILNFDDLSNTVMHNDQSIEAYEITLSLEDCAKIAFIMNEQHWRKGYISVMPGQEYTPFSFSKKSDSSENSIEYYPKSGIFSYAGYLAFASERATLEINEILLSAEENK